MPQEVSGPCLAHAPITYCPLDNDAAAVILQSGFLNFEDATFMEWLLEVSVCTSGNLAISAHTALERVCEEQSSEDNTVVVSVTPLLKALSRLGIRQDILTALYLEAPFHDRLVLPDAQRSEALWRLSEIVRALASGELLDAEDVPAYFGLLVVIGMDVNADLTLRLSIKRALNTLIETYFGEFTESRSDMVSLKYGLIVSY